MITSLTNPKVKYVRRLQQDRRFRQREAVMVVEGSRWMQEVAAAAIQPTLLFHTDTWREQAENASILQQGEIPFQPVSEAVMAAMSDTETPQGVLAVLPQPDLPIPAHPSLLLILDGISTPGNLGTMLRTAAAAGVDGVWLAPGCVDAFNPKVVRGSMGALLRLPLRHATWAEIAESSAGLPVWAAVVDEDAVPYTAVSWQQPAALMIGSEAWGISREGRQLSSNRLTIPMHAATESLNAAVAAAVILFEAARQRCERSD